MIGEGGGGTIYLRTPAALCQCARTTFPPTLFLSRSLASFSSLLSFFSSVSTTRWTVSLSSQRRLDHARKRAMENFNSMSASLFEVLIYARSRNERIIDNLKLRDIYSSNMISSVQFIFQLSIYLLRMLRYAILYTYRKDISTKDFSSQ